MHFKIYERGRERRARREKREQGAKREKRENRRREMHFIVSIFLISCSFGYCYNQARSSQMLTSVKYAVVTKL